MEEEKDGVWKTIRGRRVFIRNGEKLTDAIKRSKMSSDKTSYKEDIRYKYLSKRLHDLDERKRELHDNEPKQNEYDYSKPVSGITPEEWSELSKTEKEMLIDMNRKETGHDKWLKEVMSIDEQRSDILLKMKEMQNKAFEKRRW